MTPTALLSLRPGRCGGVLRGAVALLLAMASAASGQAGDAGSAPGTLRETGLYADSARLEVDSRHVAFAPQYPLWTDGAQKRRWISLPPGTAIDASDPESWEFPVGTRFWKEFAFEGRRVETRYLERLADGQWLYAAYVWSADGREATLVSERGQRGAYPMAEGRAHTIPGVTDCKVCHQAGPGEVLGFTALQLSPDRDPGALHAEPPTGAETDLASLVERGLLVGLPRELLETPPRIVAGSAAERAALGYLHGNCGHCHNADGRLANLGLVLRAEPGAAVQPAVASTVGHPIRKMAPGQPAEAILRIAPGQPERSGLLQRIASRYAALQMPPLGTELVDGDAVALIERWIAELDDLPVEAQKTEETRENHSEADRRGAAGAARSPGPGRPAG
jgi:hypothetical protein